MKLNFKKQRKRNDQEFVPKPKKKRRGPKLTIGACPNNQRLNFFSGDALDKLPKLNRLLKKAGAPKVTISFALREAVKPWIRKQIIEAKKALDGTLHAKPRKI